MPAAARAFPPNSSSVYIALDMAWNTALDGNGTTYYWNEHGQSQYEKPADYDPATAQNAGAYSQYGGGGGGGRGHQTPANDYSQIGMQYSRPMGGGGNYKDVQDGAADRPADDQHIRYSIL